MGVGEEIFALIIGIYLLLKCSTLFSFVQFLEFMVAISMLSFALTLFIGLLTCMCSVVFK